VKRQQTIKTNLHVYM